MSAETFARTLAVAVAIALVLVVLALLPRFRSLRESPPPRPPLRVVAFITGVAILFQLVDALVRR